MRPNIELLLTIVIFVAKFPFLEMRVIETWMIWPCICDADTVQAWCADAYVDVDVDFVDNADAHDATS